MYNTIVDLKVLCGKKPGDLNMDDVNLLSDGKTQWELFLSDASEFAAMKIRAWGFESVDISKLKQAEVFLVKAFMARAEFNQSINDVSTISLVGVQSVTMRKTSMEEIELIIKGYLDMAYNVLQVAVLNSVLNSDMMNHVRTRDYVLVC